MNVLVNAVPNFGARVMPLPFSTAWLVETDYWQSTTWTLRRFTDKQRIALDGRARHYGCKATGSGIPFCALPVVAVLDHVDLWDTVSTRRSK